MSTPAALKFPAKPRPSRNHVPVHSEGVVRITGRVVTVAIARSFQFPSVDEAERHFAELAESMQ